MKAGRLRPPRAFRVLLAGAWLAAAAAVACAETVAPAGWTGGTAPLVESGSYVRRFWHLPLYRVTLETAEPRAVAAGYRQSLQRGGRPAAEPAWDELAAFLLDPRNRLPVRLTLQILVGVKGYADESRSIRDSLGRMGLALDEQWRLQGGPGEGRPWTGGISAEGPGLQEEVTRLAEAMIGLSADRPGPYFRQRRKGDAYVFCLDGQGRASVLYRPTPDNRAARPGRMDFQDHRVVAALVGACLLPAADEEGASSAALLQAIREAFGPARRGGNSSTSSVQAPPPVSASVASNSMRLPSR